MARAKKNDGMVPKLIHVNPTALEIIDRYCYHTGTNAKEYIENCIILVSERIKLEHPEYLYKPRPKRYGQGISEFNLPNQVGG